MSYPDRTVEADRSLPAAMATSRDAGSELARQVAHTATDELRRAGIDVRQRLREEVDHQHRQVVDRVGAFAEQLHTMASQRPDTPAGELVGVLAAQSRSFAEYLDQHGPERVLHELQDFARRRPGTFIAAAAATGFVLGRLGKGLWQDQHESHRS